MYNHTLPPELVKLLVGAFSQQIARHPLPWSMDLESYKASVGILDARRTEFMLVQTVDQANLLIAFAKKLSDEQGSFMRQFDAFLEDDDHDGLVAWLSAPTH